MIPLSTPPGAKIVCVDAEASDKFMPPGAVRAHRGLHGLREGEVYTISRWQVLEYVNIPPVVVLEEITRPHNPSANIVVDGFSPHRFRLAVTPGSIASHKNVIENPNPVKKRVTA